MTNIIKWIVIGIIGAVLPPVGIILAIACMFDNTAITIKPEETHKIKSDRIIKKLTQYFKIEKKKKNNKYIIGFDPGTKEGDRSVVVVGHINRKTGQTRYDKLYTYVDAKLESDIISRVNKLADETIARLEKEKGEDNVGK